MILQSLGTRLQDTEDTGCNADLHMTFTTSGQTVAVCAAGRKAVGDKRSVPDRGEIDGWMEVSLTSSNIF